MEKGYDNIIVLNNVYNADVNKTDIKDCDSIIHPEGKIRLLDGRIIDCFPKTESFTMPDGTEQLSLDSTSEYLTLKQYSRQDSLSDEQRTKEEYELFLKNAFFFLSMKDRILNDSRLFLARVPIQSGIAYTGTSGFRNVTLGIYIEWWLNCREANFIEDFGIQYLVCKSSGSPLSGSNICIVSKSDGEYLYAHLKTFLPVWSNLIKINTRYTEAKETFQAYTLKDAFYILKKENSYNQ